MVQEIVLARNVMFYCGKSHSSENTDGRLPSSKLDSNVTSRGWVSYLSYYDAVNEFRSRKEAGEPLSNFGLNFPASS